MGFSQYQTKEWKDVLEKLGTSETGLSFLESKNRLRVHGLNEIKAREPGLLNILLRQLKSPFFYLLFGAALLALLIGEIVDSLVILAFVVINVTLGFWQEARASRSLRLLKKYLPHKTRVLREGQEKEIDKGLLVPGDIVFLEAGDIVPADLRLIKASNLLVDESVLSGEAFPCTKEPLALKKETSEIFEAKNILFAGTAVVSGKSQGVAIATGKETVFGQMAKLVSTIDRESSYEKNLLRFSRTILRIVVITIIFIFLANLVIRGSSNFLDFLIFSIALVVSIIPEALPVVVTFSLSKGALRLAKEKVVVQRLGALQDLGDIDILCTDKTGTLTEGRFRLENIYSPDKQKCLLYGLLSSSCVREEIESTINPFDAALLAEAPTKTLSFLKKFELVAERPFDPSLLSNSVVLKGQGDGFLLISKGAPERILDLCKNTFGRQERQEIKRKIERLGMAGKRVLAIGFKNLKKPVLDARTEKDLTFLGYFAFSDPLKRTAKEAVQLAKKLNLEIKILTGDSKEVAGHIAQEMGLIESPGAVALAKDLDDLSDEDFERACQDLSVFARVSPETKHRIVATLQKKYQVGFLGEGVNDVPALKTANLAIAVQKAADISRQASDIILLKKDLRVIVNGIKEGRNIFSNINKYIKCTIASNFGNFYSIALISLAIPFLPMLAIQILLVNLLSDFPLIAIASDRVEPEELKRPKSYQLNQAVLLIAFLALASSLFDLVFFAVFHKLAPPLLRTLWFLESILTEILLIFSIRTSSLFLKSKPPSWPLVFFAFLAIIITLLLPFSSFGQEAFHFVAPPAFFVIITLGLIVAYFLTSEMIKLWYYYYRSKQQAGIFGFRP